MDLKQLEYFTVCAKLSSLTKAAEALYTTQPHVSMVIRSLEKELGTALFHRHSGGVTLTEDGMQIFSYAEKTLRNADTIRQMGRSNGSLRLRIACNPSSYMASVFTEYYEQLQQEHVFLQFTECGIEKMMELMSREHYDLGFVFAPMDRIFAMKMMADNRHLEYVELFRSGLVIHVSEKHPCFHRAFITPEELVGLSFIQVDEDYFTLEELLGKSFQSENSALRLNQTISTNSDHLMIRMLEEGKVCNLGSYWLREKFRDHNFRMIPILGGEEKISFGYLKHRRHPLRPAAARFMDFLTQEVLSGEKKAKI